ncbi:MAG: transcription termination/antitermination protein NusA [Lentisphaeria bacterium]|nr:transcription termination/antitermination protein NusA [Lentisphaeria bacterium]
MNNELLTMLEYIEQERGISKEQLVAAVESAITSSLKKSKLMQAAPDLQVKLDTRTGQIRAWSKVKVIDGVAKSSDEISLMKARTVYPDVQVGDEVDWEVTPQNFGRIAAQTARQTIIQKLRDAEKEIVKVEFQDKIGEIVNGSVKRMEAGAIIVDLQKSEGIIQAKERVPGEVYMIGERINALLLDVDTKASGPSLILSRSKADFVRKLFEREVSEIHDGVVEIAHIVREAGMRTKIAVRSNDPRVDPVGACVGMRGMRVRNITAELGNERVDIIRYDEDIQVYAANALHPAKLESIEVDDEHRMLNIHVNQENSRLAFGKKGQNVRLAQKLIGWNINFVIDQDEQESFEEKKAQVVEQLSGLLGITPEQSALLVNNGYLSMDGLKTAGMKDIGAIPGMTEESLSAIAAALEKFTGASGQAE